ncbi:hypothetical protein RD110_08560 [Rhodoferax koreense]|uniref:Diguanylate cyclase n=1 Tax=Rhodoferax koreensis TaxID=1842727 RepID=A0A1P8JU73_9BURK|nr:EAL domain-containing protein [Rhodoferax koreense]APW37241.1 hypothetical protein RD110_08560 [Rhodoferax koreense]
MAKVLVVDDVAENRELIVMLMRYAQHEALEARDGEEALALAHTHRPDLVICDILMPKMDGYAFARRLREEPALSTTEIIFYTATFMEKEAAVLAAGCGVSHVLHKPCEPEEVLRVVAQVLENACRPAAVVPRVDADFDRDHLRLVTDKLIVKAEELERANQRLAALTELAMQLASERDPQVLLDKFCQGVRVLFDARGAVLAIRDRGHAQKVHLTVAGLAAEEQASVRSLPVDAATADASLRGRRAMRFEPGAGHAALRQAVQAVLPRVTSGLLAPVASLHHGYGWVLLLDKAAMAGFSTDDEHTLAVQAAQTGRIYENGWLYARVQHQLGQLQAQTTERERADELLRLDHAVALALASSDDVGQGLRSVLRAVCQSQAWELGRYWQVDEARNLLKLTMLWSPPGQLSADFLAAVQSADVRRPGEGLAGNVWQQGLPLWIADLRCEPRVASRTSIAEGLRCASLFPVFDAERPIGVLSFLSRSSRPRDERLQASGQAIANQLGQYLQRRRAEAALLASERFARSTLDSLSEHICVLDQDGVIVAVNRAWRESVENDAQAALRPSEGTNYLNTCEQAADARAPEAGSLAAGIREVLLGSRHTFAMEYRCDSRTQRRWFLARISRFSGEGPLRVVVAHEDISEGKRAEERIRRLHRVSSVMSDINALIVRAPHRDELFREACRISVHTGRFKTAWIGLFDGDHWHLDIVARFDDGTAADHFEAVRESIHRHLRDRDMRLQRLVLHGETVVENDIATSVWLTAPAQASVLAAGSRSLALLPLIVSKRTAGMLVLHAGEADFFDAREIRLLEELANDIAFAMDHIAQSDKLNRLAYYDVLTGQANAMLFQERLGRYVAGAQEKQEMLALVILDIERFKAINDSLGRRIGDEVLREVARRIVHAVEDATRMARVGADQFAMVFPNATEGYGIARVLQDFYRSSFDAPVVCGAQALHISARIGIALCPADGTTAETLYLNAEAALKRAKASPDRMSFYDARMAASIAEKVALENKLREALARGRFVLHYQPKAEAARRHIESVEALIRWQDPEFGLVPPARFIPLLEETGLIVEVGAWALRQAVLDRQYWLGLGLAAPRIAVNVSAVQLRKVDFVATVELALATGGADPGIDLEITESAAMENIEDTILKLKTLRGLGVDIAIDDFGTGYSSLAYLAKLPVQVLKIDRAFVMTMNEDPNQMTLVTTMVSLAHALGMKVVAEGVETEAQAQTLLQLRCDQLQGYLISRPVPAEALAAMLARRIEDMA